MIDIEPVPFAVVAPYAGMAAREHVTVKETQSTQWFAMFTSRRTLVGFGGIWQKGMTARIKGDFVLPSERGQGYYGMLIRHRLRLILVRHVDTIEVYQNSEGRPDLWPNHGFTYIETRPNGGRLYRATPAQVRDIVTV